MAADSGIARHPVPGFPLMPDRKNKDGILILLEAVKCHVARAAARYHQFPQAMLDGATDQRMTEQQIDRFFDQSNRLRCRTRIRFGQEVGQPFEVGERAPRMG